MKSQSTYWEQAKFFFENNDGSLPELKIEKILPKEMLEIFQYLLSISNKLPDSSTVWVQDSEKKCNEFDSFEELFIALKNDSRHILLNGIKKNNVNIPPLGCIIYNNEIEFDYRMGADWNESTFNALIYLFIEIKVIAPNCIIRMPLDGEAPFLKSDINKLNFILEKLICNC